MWARDLVEAVAWHVLPTGVTQELRRRHYYRVLMKDNVVEPELALLGLFVKPGACVVDVGANFGRYTKALADLVGPAGRVYSLEPVPETFAILTANVERMGLGNVIPLRRAVSDAHGERVTLVVPKDRPFGLENAYQARIARGPAQGREVTAETCTLDRLLAEETTPVSFVKCDVEGHELVCLRGAMDLIRRSRPTWLIEVTGDPRGGESSARSLFQLLGELGYRAYVADGKELRPWRPDEGLRVNYFFVPNGAARELSQH